MDRNDSTLSLLDLPDCVTITLLSYLDATSLYTLSRVCKRFENLVKDDSLWRYIDARSPPHSKKVLQYIMDRVNERTKSVLTAGYHNEMDIIPEAFFETLSLSKQLTILVLENHFFDADLVTMRTLPESLVELSLKRCYVKNSEKFFKHSLNTKSNLKVLVLDECNWVETSSLMSISRYEKLEILSLYNCSTIDNSIPYLSLAGSFGFKSLKVIDARLTELGNALLKSIYKSGSLLAIYLQSESIPDKIYELKNRLKSLNDPKQIRKSLDEATDVFYVDDYSSLENSRLYADTVNDRGLIEYARIEGTTGKHVLPESRLYRYPYGECRCVHKTRTPQAKLPDASHDNDNDNNKGDSSESDDSSDDDDDSNSGENGTVKAILKQRIKSTIARLRRSANNFRRPVITRRHPNRSYAIDIINGFHPIGSVDPIEQILFGLTDPVPPTPSRSNNSRHDIAVILGDMHQTAVNPAGNGGAASTSQASSSSGPSRTQTNHNLVEPRKRKSENENINLKRPKLSNNDHNSENGDAAHEDLLNQNNLPNLNDCHVIALVPAHPHNIRILNRYHPDPLDKCKVPLKHLSLRGFIGVSDIALDYLKNLSLELLDLTGTRASKEGIERYLAYNPNCRIMHKNYCICKPKLSFQ